MKKLLLVAILILAIPVFASADVVLQVTVPTAWIPDTSAAIEQAFPGKPNDWNIKRWAEYQMREWLRGIVAEYRTNQDMIDALTSQGYVVTAPGDVPITTPSGD